MFVAILFVMATAVHSALRCLMPLAFVHVILFVLNAFFSPPVFLHHSSFTEIQYTLPHLLNAFLEGLCESCPGPSPYSCLHASVANLCLFLSSCLS